MPTTMSDYLHRAVTAVQDVHDGEVSPVSPPLASGTRQPFGVALVSRSGEAFSAGDAAHPFAIQSISKAIVYAMALEEHGHDKVETFVNHEPSGERYDAISVEADTGRPDNPMINAGAITVHGLIGGPRAEPEERVEQILATFSAMAGRRLEIDWDTHAKERETADRNLAIAHLIRALKILPGDPRDVVDGYLKQCSVQVTANDLAMMAATLANDGRNPVSGERVFSPVSVRQALSVMLTCGMYDATGDWVSEVGIPAKSGVGGGILGVIPGRGGIAAFAPKLDEHGTSVRGQLAFEELSDSLGLHFVEVMTGNDTDWEKLLAR